MTTGTGAATVLAEGEMFIEYPDTGSGTGHCRMKMGDGVTAYSVLPYAIGDTSTDEIDFTADSSTTITTALNKVISGAQLKIIVPALKQAVSLANTAIGELNDTCASMKQSFQAGVDAVYDAVKAKGSTPASHSLSDVVRGIADIPVGITPTGTISITTNGTHNVTNYASASVAVPASAVCSGTISITSNGSKTVTGYKTASVSVPKPSGYVTLKSAGSDYWVFYKVNGGTEQRGTVTRSGTTFYC
jgi:hypothetical protein